MPHIISSTPPTPPLQVQLPHWPVLEGFEASWETYLARLQGDRDSVIEVAGAMRRVTVKRSFKLRRGETPHQSITVEPVGMPSAVAMPDEASVGGAAPKPLLGDVAIAVTMTEALADVSADGPQGEAMTARWLGDVLVEGTQGDAGPAVEPLLGPPQPSTALEGAASAPHQPAALGAVGHAALLMEAAIKAGSLPVLDRDREPVPVPPQQVRM